MCARTHAQRWECEGSWHHRRHHFLDEPSAWVYFRVVILSRRSHGRSLSDHQIVSSMNETCHIWTIASHVEKSRHVWRIHVTYEGVYLKGVLVPCRCHGLSLSNVWVMPRMNSLSHIWMSHVTRMNGTCRVWISYVPVVLVSRRCHGPSLRDLWVMPHMNLSRHIWMSHVTYKRVIGVTYECDMSHVWMSHTRCHVWKSIVFLCYMTPSYVTWRIHQWCDSFICDMTHSYVTWLIHMWHDSFICDMTHSYVTRLIHVWHDESHMSCHVWTFIRDMSHTSHVTYEWDMSHMNASCHVWKSHVTHERDTW